MTFDNDFTLKNESGDMPNTDGGVTSEKDTYYVACPECSQKGMVEYEKNVKPDKCPTCNYQGIFIRCL